MAPFSIILVGEFCVTIYTRGNGVDLGQTGDIQHFHGPGGHPQRTEGGSLQS